ncbi:MAG: hypothetical protein CM15mP93_08580 [Thiotrichaceae bacterium]|nr:MAG: hypothetical protein CM15mP93_08580 [Thiotrichaceae bacterium]
MLNAIVGSAGLKSSMNAVKSGKKLLLANKEPLVMCGDLLMELQMIIMQLFFQSIVNIMLSINV